MNLRWLIAPVLVCCSAGLFAQAPASGQTVFVVPFENRSHAPGLEWISESFPELFYSRLNSRSLYVLNREDRIRAYDRLGIPTGIRASRATIYRIAEQMDVDVVVFGSFTFDGRAFSATAQLLDMRYNLLSPQFTASGPLVKLIDVQTELAWDLLHHLHPEISPPRQAYIASAQPVRLDAFENYVRGLAASGADEQIERLREAVRLSPDYSEALLALGKAYYREHQYDQAIASLSRVAVTSPQSREANFYLGVAAYLKGDYARAEAAFSFVASRLPLPEIYNNLGAAELRRGNKNASEQFQKAVEADPNDADYRFNLALALYRAGDFSGASRQLRQALSLRPNDTEAKAFLDVVGNDPTTRVQHAAFANGHIPTERIRRNYNESSFHQLALKVQATAEQKLAKADPRTHARFHSDRGHELLAQGFVAEAEQEFREAVNLDASNAEAHAGLGRVLFASGDPSSARAEAEAALRLRTFAEPYLLLADLDLRDNRIDMAAENVDRALRLEPGNSSARAMKTAVTAKLAQKAQPLPSQ